MHSPDRHPSDRVVVLEQSNYLLSCMTILRSCETSSRDFSEAFENVAIQIIVAGTERVY
jgi:hypothetical protein